MSSRKFFLAFVLALSASACSKSLDDGYAVDITVKALDSLDAATVTSVQSLDFTVRGAERTAMSFPVTRAFGTQRKETIIYRPLVAAGDLEFVVRARDGSGTIVGYADGKLSLVAKKTVTLTLSLSGDLPPALLDADPSRDFGTVLVGQSSGPQVLTVTNLGGMPSGPLVATLGGADADAFVVQTDLCTGNALEAGASCAITLQATPTHAGMLGAVLTAAATPGGSIDIALSASSQEPGALKADPSSHDFGAIIVGQASDPTSFTITNSGADPLGPLMPSVTGSAAASFPLGTENCTGATLQPGDSCTVSVRFQPAGEGLVSASLQVGDGTSTPAVANVQGIGLSPSRLQATPSMPDFGSLVVGSTLDLTVTIKNVGGAATGALTSMLGGADAAQFSLVTDGCNGQPLAASGSCIITVRFAPMGAGAKGATLTVSGMPGGSATSMLVGTGLQPGALSLTPPMGDFGTLLVNTKSTVQTFTVTNTGGAPTGSLTVMLSGSDASQYKLTGDNCSGTTLGGGGTCQINLQFAPDSPGTKSSATLVVGASPGGNASSTLTGISQRPAVLGATPGTSANLGTSTVGVAGSMTTFTITNNGDQPTTVLGSTTNGNIGDFLVTDNCAGLTLAGGVSCIIKFQLKPTSYGSKSAALTVSATTGGSVTLNVSGVGQDTVTLTLTLPGSGGGTLSATGQTACTSGPCTWNFTRGATVPSVTINEAPDGTSDFTSWGGDCSGTATSCTLSMSVNRAASATFTRRKVTLTINKPALDAGGTGTVTSSVGGINCGATCTAQIDAGTTVTLTASVSAGVFQGWSGDCSGDGTTCTLTMSGARTVGAAFLHTRYNYVFTTSMVYDGAIGGLSGADAKCQAAAAGAGLHGTFKSYMATAAGPVTTISRLAGARGWVRRDGRPFVDQATDITTAGNKVYYPPRLNEFGQYPTSGYFVGTGTDGTGNPAYNAGVPYTCADWTSNASSSQYMGGRTSGMGLAWQGGYIIGCDSPMSLACFGVDQNATLTFTKAAGRTAFVSQASFDPSTGVAGADKLCHDEAVAVGLPGTYLALISTSTTPAASRFSTALAPWVNVNGVAISEKAIDLFTPGVNLLGAIYLNGSGGLAGNVAANGSTDPNKVGTNNCKDWTSNASTDSADVGVPSDSMEVFGVLSWDCQTIKTFGHAYCLQQ